MSNMSKMQTFLYLFCLFAEKKLETSTHGLTKILFDFNGTK